MLRDGIYEVDWTVDFSAEEITFFVTAKTKGFVGFGISYTGSMQHSDIVIGDVFENGTTYFSVCHLPTELLNFITFMSYFRTGTVIFPKQTDFQ